MSNSDDTSDGIPVAISDDAVTSNLGRADTVPAAVEIPRDVVQAMVDEANRQIDAQQARRAMTDKLQMMSAFIASGVITRSTRGATHTDPASIAEIAIQIAAELIRQIDARP